MSYPFIGLEGIGYQKYDAATIERMLREGHRIYDDRFRNVGSGGTSFFEDGKFKFEHPVFVEWDDDPVQKTEEFDSFVELAAFVAFYWMDFL
jgi:hypothetical protein